MSDQTITGPAPSTDNMGYWQRVARDGPRMGFWFVLPTLLLLLFIVVFPLLMQLYLSFTWWTPLEGIPWYQAWEVFNWGENYWFMITDPRFWGALWRCPPSSCWAWLWPISLSTSFRVESFSIRSC